MTLYRPGFVRFWSAHAVSEFGSYITTFALQVLVVTTLSGSATDVGVVNAARWLPYLLFGLVAGVLADRLRRRPMLVGTDLARGVLLSAVPLLALTGMLTVPLLAVFMVAFGALSLLHDATHQSFLPQLVPRQWLTPANARLEQSSAVAQTSGPLLAGGLVSWLGAPLAVLADAVSYFASGVLIAAIRVDEPRPATKARPAFVSQVREGLSWVYRHRTLMPMAVSTHSWFLCFSMVSTVYVPFALRGLGFDAFLLGITFAAAGVGALIGSGLSTRLSRLLGICPTIAGSRALEAVGLGLVALAPAAAAWPAPVMVCAGQFLFGLGLGTEGPIEMSYRQSVTPDRLQGRMNSTMRSVNRAAVVVGAPLGGVLADVLGYRPALWIGITGLAAGALALRMSSFREAGKAASDSYTY